MSIVSFTTSNVLYNEGEAYRVLTFVERLNSFPELAFLIMRIRDRFFQVVNGWKSPLDAALVHRSGSHSNIFFRRGEFIGPMDEGTFSHLSSARRNRNRSVPEEVARIVNGLFTQFRNPPEAMEIEGPSF